MPADGEITLTSLLREYRSILMPRGVLSYGREKSSIYGTALVNATLVTGTLAVGRFMYFGRASMAAVLPPSTGAVFLMVAGTSVGMIYAKQKKEEDERAKNDPDGVDSKQYLRFTGKQPMLPGAPRAPDNIPMSEDSLKLYGLESEDKADKKDCKQCADKPAADSAGGKDDKKKS